MKRPRLLFVSPRFLFPLDEGGKIRTAGILRALKGGAFDISLASPAPTNAEFYSDALSTVSDHFISWPEVQRSKLARGLSLLGRWPVSVAADRSRAARTVIESELGKKPSLVVADFPHAAVFLPPRIDPPSLIFTHNVETTILERHAAVSRFPWRSVWALEATKMFFFEKHALQLFDTVVAVSDRDSKELVQRFGLNHVKRIDTGIDLEFYQFNPPPNRPEPRPDAGIVVFCGAMDSHSNIDGANFLMDDIWPLVVAKRPHAQMVVVGRNPPQSLMEKAKAKKLSWMFTGYVEDTRPFIVNADVAVIPLRVGSGTRLKAFESMSLGRPVVSTSIGVEGLGLDAGIHYLVGDTPVDFATGIIRLLDDNAARDRIARSARNHLEKEFSWHKVGRSFEEICLETLQRKA